jgi:DNA polymerase II small subunit/DNA polymerase delta subunit B
MPSAEGSSTAARIDIVQPSVMGKVTAVNGDTITIAGPNSTSATVIVSNATTYTKDGASASLADVTVGSSIFAEGSFTSPTDTSSLDATNVGIGQPGTAGPGFEQPGGPGPQGALHGSQPSAVHAN